MSLPLAVRPEAEQDTFAARDWYDDQRDGFGIEFLTALDAAFDRIKSFPESCAAEYRGVRRAPLDRFPYVVYYRIGADMIEVIAVLHGSRHQSAWHSRA